MKASTTPRRALLVTAVVTALTLLLAFVARSADGKSRLAEQMIGTWVRVGAPGEVGEPPAKGGRLKFRTGRHWTMTDADPETGLVTTHDGGTYTLDGNEYVESLDYATEASKEDIGKKFKFTVKIEGDLMTQTGIDNPYTEVWKRLK
jgi:hypothetical protein